MPFKVKPASKKYQPLVKILDYKQEMCQIINNIHSVDVFRMIDIDLPDNYLNSAQFT